MSLLEVRSLQMRFGGVTAVNDLSFNLDSGEILALIGPNGAGKTTAFNCISGVYAPASGSIRLNSSDRSIELSGKKMYQINQAGIARTFQNIRLFENMSALENVLIGRHAHLKSGIISALTQHDKVKNEEKLAVEKSWKLLRRLGLENWANAAAKNLPYGLKRRLEIARALATEPVLLLLDEPAAGMNPKETLELDDLILQIRSELGISILLIEHDMGFVMRMAERILVMNYGKLIAQGAPAEIRQNRAVIEAYLGEDESAVG